MVMWVGGTLHCWCFAEGLQLPAVGVGIRAQGLAGLSGAQPRKLLFLVCSVDSR